MGKAHRRVLVVLALMLAMAACSGDDGTGGNGGGGNGGGGDGGGGDGGGDAFDALMAQAAVDIDAFWEDRFSELSQNAYHGPSDVQAYEPGTLPATTGCGLASEDPMNWIDNAFHCSDDHLIAYDRQFLRRIQEADGDFAPIAVLAHEFGHHVQTLADRPTIAMQRELQADCYAGIYIAHAAEAGTFAEGDIREAVVTFFKQGDRNYSEETWFDARVHGPPHERALATGSGLLTEDVDYCANYGSYAPRDPLSIGTYTLYVPAALTSEALSNGMTRIAGPRADAYLRYEPDVGTGAATASLPTIAQDWFGSGWTPLEEPHDAGVATVFGGTDALQAYEWTFVDAEGVTRQQHGAMLLLASGTGDGIVIDVARPGPAPDLNSENMQAIGDFLYLLAWGVCPPSAASWACEVGQ